MKIYKCQKCNKEYKNKYDYKRHLNRKKPCVSTQNDKADFTCPKCGKLYSSKYNLKRHIDQYCKATLINRTISAHKSSKTCTNNEQKYTCSKCGKSYTRKSSLNRHLLSCNMPENTSEQKVNNCASDSEQLVIKHDQCENEELNWQEIQCGYCHKKFTTKTSMYRHIRNTCKVKKDMDTKEEIYQSLLAKMDKLVEQNEKLVAKNEELQAKVGQTINNNITNNTTNNNNIVNNMNIKLVAFGQEDRDSMKNSEIFNILRRGFSSVPELVRAIHFNEERPENHNIYISNMRDNFVMVYDGDKWGLRDRNETIQNIFDDGRNFLVVKYNDMKEKFTDKHRHAVKKFERFDSNIDRSSNKKDQVFNDIKMILYNGRDLPLKTRKSLTE